jgi:hypothetical protein
MLVDRLKKEGHKAIYVRPISILMSSLPFWNHNDLNKISPRIFRTSTAIDNARIHQFKNYFMCILGYLYAFISFILIKLLSINRIVVCDRYFYQFFFDLFGKYSKYILIIFPGPDIVFFLEGSLDALYLRMVNPYDASVRKEYYIDIMNLYKYASKKYKFFKIKSHIDKNLISDEIYMTMLKYI